MPKSWLRTITSRSSFRSVSIDAIREVWSRLNIQRCFELKRSWNFCVCLDSTCVGSNACKATINFGTGEINLRKSNCLVQHLQWKSPRTFRTKKKRSHSMQTMYFFFLSFFFWGTMVTLEHNALEFFYVYALSTWTNSQPTKNCHCRRHHYVLYLVSYWTLHAQCM